MRALILASLLTLAATAALPYSVEPLPLVTLTGDKAQVLAETGVTLLLTGITDQRCPPQVDCFWEGMIRAEITVFGPQDLQQQIILCNLCDDGQRSAIAAGQELTLIGLAPSTEELAKLARKPVLTDYQLTVAYGRVPR